MARRSREGGLVVPLTVGNAANVQLWGRAVGGQPRIQAQAMQRSTGQAGRRY
jgi:hypothetical protein